MAPGAGKVMLWRSIGVAARFLAYPRLDTRSTGS
jgi:hypothetical protein